MDRTFPQEQIDRFCCPLRCALLGGTCCATGTFAGWQDEAFITRP